MLTTHPATIKEASGAQHVQSNSYVSMKVRVLEPGPESDAPVSNEIRMLQHIDKCAQAGEDQEYPGLLLTRRATDIFGIPGKVGRHQCIVSKAESASLHYSSHSTGYITDAALYTPTSFQQTS
ncbi:hypothetical protein BST61_g590 [Cercospora zeina]